jgi:Tfp pilus assembly protein PilE
VSFFVVTMTKRQDGFTMVELLFAVAVLIVSGVWMLSAYHSALQTTAMSQQWKVAVNDLHDMMERIKSTPFAQLNASFPNGTANGTANAYATVVGTYTLNGESITVTHFDLAGAPSITADPRELVVTIQWTDKGRTYTKTVRTMRSSKSI